MATIVSCGRQLWRSHPQAHHRKGCSSERVFPQQQHWDNVFPKDRSQVWLWGSDDRSDVLLHYKIYVCTTGHGAMHSLQGSPQIVWSRSSVHHPGWVILTNRSKTVLSLTDHWVDEQQDKELVYVQLLMNKWCTVHTLKRQARAWKKRMLGGGIQIKDILKLSMWMRIKTSGNAHIRGLTLLLHPYKDQH